MTLTVISIIRITIKNNNDTIMKMEISLNEHQEHYYYLFCLPDQRHQSKPLKTN